MAQRPTVTQMSRKFKSHAFTQKMSGKKKTVKIINVNENYYKQNSHDNKKISQQLASLLQAGEFDYSAA